MTDLEKRLLAALKGVVENPHVELGDLVYDIRESLLCDWLDPRMTAWSDAVEEAKAAIKEAEGL